MVEMVQAIGTQINGRDIEPFPRQKECVPTNAASEIDSVSRSFFSYLMYECLDIGFWPQPAIASRFAAPLLVPIEMGTLFANFSHDVCRYRLRM
jgi:hypothetical protein